MRIKAAIASHPFRSILFPWANYVTMAFLICVLIGMYFNEDTRMSLFVGIIFMLVVTAIYKVLGLIATVKRINWRNKQQNAQTVTKRAIYLKKGTRQRVEVRIIHPPQRRLSARSSAG